MSRFCIVLSLSVVALTLSAGCGTEATDCAATAPASCPADAPSYQTDVAPLLATYCTSCHGPGGEESDKPLGSYSAVKGLSNQMSAQIEGCYMPPPDSNQPSDDERNVILTWIKCGAPDN